MNQELTNKLYEKYPKIFRQKDLSMQETLMCWGFECGDGWYNIIDTLCHLIQQRIDQPHKDIEMYEGWIQEHIEDPKPEKLFENGSGNTGRIPGSEELIANYKERIEQEKKKIIPQVEAVQVKEKYGTLRFYVNEYNDTIRNFISFAESMSACTCESCGRPGEANNVGWISTLCEDCREKRNNRHKEA